MPDTKISALAAATTLLGTESLPIVQGGSTRSVLLNTVAARVNLIPAELRYWGHGDSKAGGAHLGGYGNGQHSWLAHGCALYPHHFQLIGVSNADGQVVDTHYTSTTDYGVASDYALTAMIANGAANTPGGANVLLLQAFTNQASGVTAAIQKAAYEKICAKARLAGYVLIIVNGVDTKASDTLAGAALLQEIDEYLRQSERLNRDVWYFSSTAGTVNVTSSTRAHITVPRATTSDGIHDSGFGGYQRGLDFSKLLARKGVPKLRAQVPMVADYGGSDPSKGANPLGNVYGPDGWMQSTGNSAGVRIVGGTVSGAANWPGSRGDADEDCIRLTGQLRGVPIKIEQILSPLNDEFGRATADIKATRITLNHDGTNPTSVAVASSELQIGFYVHKQLVQMTNTPGGLPANIKFRQHLIWRANALVGLMNQPDLSSNSAHGIEAAGQLPTLDGIFWRQDQKVQNMTEQFTGYGNFDFTGFYIWNFGVGTTPTGSIDIIQLVGRQHAQPVAAAA